MNNNDETHTIAFYNIENLFDIKNDPSVNDKDFLPTSTKRWTRKRYEKKLLKIGSVISKIGDEHKKKAPIIVGLAEVENHNVLSDLIISENLKEEAYRFIHFDSPDERGIDVALLYKDEFFEVTNAETFSVYLQKESGEQDYTRDILLVQGLLNNEQVSIIVNHWSSRREGVKETEVKRLAAARVVNKIIKNLKNEDSTDFESLFPLITKTGKARNSIYLAMFDDQRGIISEDKKLIIYPKTGDLELYDLEKDPWETNNMISNQKTKSTILKLLNELKAWQEKTGDETDLSAIYKQYF